MTGFTLSVQSVNADTVNSPEAWDRRARDAATSWDAAMWSERGQTVRMQAAVAALDLRPTDHLLDWGCGTGRLVEFLPDGVRYTGLDSSPEMVKRARRTYQGFRHADFGNAGEVRSRGPYTHVVSIGPWNLAEGWSKEQTQTQIEMLWRLQPTTMVLSLYAGRDPLCLRYTDTDVTRWARRLSDSWAISRPLPNDVMLTVYG